MSKTRIIQFNLGGSTSTTVMSKQMLQSSSISAVLWLIMIDKILRILDRHRVKRLLVVLVSRMHHSFMLETMEGALGKMCIDLALF